MLALEALAAAAAAAAVRRGLFHTLCCDLKQFFGCVSEEVRSLLFVCG
jgi:hypothetical protein